MRYHELSSREPIIGDILQIEFGSNLIESVIQGLTADGVIIALNADDLKTITEAPQRNVKSNIIPIRDPNFTLVPDRKKSRVLHDPSYKPSTDFQTAGFCENVVDWVIAIFNTLDITVRRFLASAGEESIMYFLKDQARSTNAYSRYGFTPDDLTTCENYLPTIVNDPGVQNWEDYLNFQIHESLQEAEYQGRKVPLGKPMKGDVKKSKVYVKKPNGKVVKVNFGDPNMKIKKSNPKRRKSFRARHNCDNPGPRWKARYWSCRAW